MGGEYIEDRYVTLVNVSDIYDPKDTVSNLQEMDVL